MAQSDGGAFYHLLGHTDMISIVGRLQLRHGNADGRLQELIIKTHRPASFDYTVSLLQKADSSLTPVAAAMVAVVKAEARKIAFAKPVK